MKHLNTFERFLNENANKKITVSLTSSAVESFKKDLDAFENLCNPYSDEIWTRLHF